MKVPRSMRERHLRECNKSIVDVGVFLPDWKGMVHQHGPGVSEAHEEEELEEQKMDNDNENRERQALAEIVPVLTLMVLRLECLELTRIMRE
jgi:hypothetical protein